MAMKKYRVRYLSIANLDLMVIDEQLGAFLAKAARFFSILDKQAPQLADMPVMHPIYDDISLYRKMVVLDYLVFYIVNETKKTVDIHRIINGKMDVQRQFAN